jgi:hypothetical protein
VAFTKVLTMYQIEKLCAIGPALIVHCTGLREKCICELASETITPNVASLQLLSLGSH